MSTPGGPRRSHRDDHEAPFGDRDGYQGTGDQGSAQRATEPPPPRRQLWGSAARPSRSRGAFRSCAVCRPLQSTVPLPPAASGSQRPRPRSKPRLRCGPGARSGVQSGAHTDGLAPVPPAPGLPRFLRPGRAPSQPPRGRPPRGRWSLVPTAPGFCLKQRPTALSPHLWPLPDQLCLLHVFSATKSLLVAFGEGVGCVQVAGVACPSLAAWNTGSLSVQRERGSHLQGRRGQRR